MAKTATEMTARVPQAHLGNRPWVPPKVSHKLQEAFLRLKALPSVERVWNGFLTEDERRGHGDVYKVYKSKGGVVAVWMKCRGVCQPRAVIDLAYRLGLMDEAEYRWLDAEISKVDPRIPPQKKDKRPSSRDTDPQERIERSIRSHNLVLVQGGGHYRLYWRGELHAPRRSWGRNYMIWEFLWTAAKQAREGGKSVSWDQLTNCREMRAIKDRKERLKHFVPDEFFDLLQPGQHSHSYELKTLGRGDIDLIELGENDWLTDRDEHAGRKG